MGDTGYAGVPGKGREVRPGGEEHVKDQRPWVAVTPAHSRQGRTGTWAAPMSFISCIHFDLSLLVTCKWRSYMCRSAALYDKPEQCRGTSVFFWRSLAPGSATFKGFPLVVWCFTIHVSSDILFFCLNGSCFMIINVIIFQAWVCSWKVMVYNWYLLYLKKSILNQEKLLVAEKFDGVLQ